MPEARAVAVDPRDRARRNVRLALAHVAAAVGFMLLFMWVQTLR